jgi:thiol-disulfide isomerase/thioredoxin
MTSECHVACETARHDQEQHERAWLIAHGYLPGPSPAPVPPSRPYLVQFDLPGAHLCPVTDDVLPMAREYCPHCKIAAPEC